MFELENLRLKFPGDERLLFKDLSVQFEKGEKVLLLGPSGCGKSTLLQVLSGLIPQSVEVPMKVEKIQLPESWGYVFQDPDSQFCMPYVDEELAFVLENLQIPREEMPERITSLLKAVGLDLADPHIPIQTLSGGMKQRLAIASVLALEPEVLFLDEPTALLDPRGTEEIWETVKRISDGKTLIIVEHKLDHVLDLVDRIILFNDHGEIIADGHKDRVLKNYRKTMQEQGIWYPGVWQDYLRNRTAKRTLGPAQEIVIELNNFSGYRKKKPLISVEEAAIRTGEWITIVGENGAGKSTLLHALMQFIKTTGHYEIHGEAIKNGKRITDHLTFVFQNPEFQFVTNSVYEEIAYGLQLERLEEPAIQERVLEVLERFRLSDYQYHHPYHLSMGQKRRLSVAASIVQGQPVLLLDEPTFGQDSKNTFALLEMLEAFQHAGVTILMVTHDRHIVEHFATRVWTIENGLLVSNEQIQVKEPVHA
ncbi:ABC transporter ATP-binding protein [Alkalihalobacillus sp. TS-13]|uniref:ABC transporter ATP-binding protein n=1 Tax=Alkalihalobacillus sp. TS-13 TaxID=2842455 RepID=UPI001C889AC9|nr:ABC transporter ATP-binding protein [Alkalihalobacillus sp. TS-13]